MFAQFYNRLKQAFQSSRFGFLFNPTALAQRLTQDQVPSAWDFFSIYFSSWWWEKLWCRWLILNISQENTFDILLNVCNSLRSAHLFTEDNCNLVEAHANSADLAFPLDKLHRAGILTQENFTLVATHADPYSLAGALYYLQDAGILTEENKALVAAHADPCGLAGTLYYLQRAGILTEENKALVVAHSNPWHLGLAYKHLQGAGILTEENKALVVAHDAPSELSGGLCELQRAGILTPDNFRLLVAHANPHDMALAASRLQYSGILTQANFTLVTSHTDIQCLAAALQALADAELLNQANFTMLIAPEHSALVSGEARNEIWSRITMRFLTQANFERLLRAAEHIHPMVELGRVRDQILGVVPGAGVHAQVFNGRQTTHTASVHRSVSESAHRLMQSYGSDLNLEVKISNIKAMVQSLDNSAKHQAAKRCIERITQLDYTFTDTSGVSTRQLLALAYTAIHDASKRAGALEAAKALLVEGLYEIQRGYNFNDLGIDQDGEDSYICSAGTFNKLMEKLNGIHPDVQVYFITQQGASLKFPSLAKAQAMTYLLDAARSATTAEDYRRLSDLLVRIKADGSLEPIWEHIKAKVQSELWDEFKEAYSNDADSEAFLGLINCGSQINAPDVSLVEQALLTSVGHQAYVDEEARLKLIFNQQALATPLLQYGLWHQRQASSEAQNAFDKQYGLVLRQEDSVTRLNP